jgi:putative transposase
MARQSSAERAWSAISRFIDKCKKSRQVISGGIFPQKNPAVAGSKGYPKFQKDNRSVEYKTTGWKLSENRKSITMTDKNGIGKLKLCGARDLNFYHSEQIKRVRLVKRADGYYVQFAIAVDRNLDSTPTHQTIGLDVGLESFYTDSVGSKIENPRFYRTGEKKLKRKHRLVSRKVKGSNNRRKARTQLGKSHLKISRQRKDHAVKLARCVISSNDVVVYENLSVRNMIKNHCLAKSINDAGWYQFRMWLEYFGKVFKRITIAVNPTYTSQECSKCSVIVKKSLSTRTHVCQCGAALDRGATFRGEASPRKLAYENAALNILKRGIATVGHTGSSVLDTGNAWGEITSTLVGAILPVQVVSLNQESPCLKTRRVSTSHY